MDTIRISRYRIRGRDTSGKPVEPFSIVVLADLHDCEIGPANSGLLDAISRQNPQAVLLAGDMITAKFGRCRMEHALRLMGALTSRYPVCAVNGNHEQRLMDRETYGDAWEKYAGKAQSLGVQLLRNTALKLRPNGMRLAVYGFEIPMEGYRNPHLVTAGMLEEVLGPAPEDCFSILLSHQPDCFAACAAWGADLTIGGHKHGGMVRLPVLGGVVGPGPQLFPRYTRGMFLENGRRMIVSAGLGGHTIPLRINNPPELVVIDIL